MHKLLHIIEITIIIALAFALQMGVLQLGVAGKCVSGMVAVPSITLPVTGNTEALQPFLE